ncbi:dynamin family protein [Streptomyces sp. NBC_00582]|uniref:dynamin family protein n=1 Tax=Streptomyces sp. NBC_00582 TaxID=2975783 RepID=UPI002E8111DB|nr:dynamin family protein [Streptomyces sp. NBC_00582]WUB59701.1 dynamin family protein [Streptomyces sp. NBC_00582]
MVRERVWEAFGRAERRLGGAQELAAARERLAEIRDGFGARLRVALVGRVSSGKSTLVNALLREERVPTGVSELTFQVTRLHRAARETLTVHYRDGRPHRVCAVEEFRAWVVSAHEDSGRQAELRAVDRLDLGLPHSALDRFDLVDTPGLDSWLGEDSARTLRFLGRTGTDLRHATVEHASRADALVLVFASGLADSEERLLAEVTGSGTRGVEPLTAVGALTKVEHYWPSCADPLAEARHVADRLMHRSGGRRTLFELVPVAGRLATGAAAATPRDIADLTALADVDPKTLTARVRRGPYFVSRDYADLPVPPERREALFRRFGGYGIVLACDLIREGLTDGAALLRELRCRSGVEHLGDVLVDHFGNRATVVKLDRAVQEARALPALADTRCDAWVRWRLEEAAEEVTRLRLTEHVFAELHLLRRLYDGTLACSPSEVAEILRLTGEKGDSPACRLGLDEDCDVDTLVRTALRRQAYWAAVDLDVARGPEVAEAARTVRRSYDLLLDRVQRA